MERSQQQSSQLSTVKKVAFAGAVNTPAGPFSTPVHQSTGNGKRGIRPIPLIQTPSPSDDKSMVADLPSHSDHEAQWTSETNQRLISLREHFRKAGYKQITKLDPIQLGYVLFTPNSARTDLMFKIFRRIHTARAFWMTDPAAAATHEAQIADKFFTVSKWYGLTSKLEVIKGESSEQEQFNFWANLITTLHSLCHPVQPPTLSKEDNCHIHQFIHSTAVENLLNSRNSGNPVPDASESVGPLKTIRGLFLNGAQRAEREIAQLSNKARGTQSQDNGDIIDLSAVGISVIQNVERIHKAVNTNTEDNNMNVNDPVRRDEGCLNWNNLGANAGYLVEMMRAVKSLPSQNNRQDGS